MSLLNKVKQCHSEGMYPTMLVMQVCNASLATETLKQELLQALESGEQTLRCAAGFAASSSRQCQ